MLRLEARNHPSAVMTWLSPLLAVAITFMLLAVLLAIMDKDVVAGLRVFLVEPFTGARGFAKTGPTALANLALKATPLILCSLGLALCFRANVFNIGAEGQYIFGAIFGGGVALWFTNHNIAIYPWLFLPVGMIAGALGGMFWAALVAALKDYFYANEILVSLMLVYVANYVLQYLVYGPWIDPAGFNFPRTVMFSSDTTVPRLFARLNWGFIFALMTAGVMWVFMTRTFKGYQITVGGIAPAAAQYAGFSSRYALWSTLLISGALAGLAGSFETLGPVGQLTNKASIGYGFTAIIVAYIARLHPIGCVAGSFLLSIMLIGGQLAQTRIGLPASFSAALQGALLFSLLACDTFISYRLRKQNKKSVSTFREKNELSEKIEQAKDSQDKAQKATQEQEAKHA